MMRRIVSQNSHVAARSCSVWVSVLVAKSTTRMHAQARPRPRSFALLLRLALRV